MRFIDAAAFKAAEGTEAALTAALRREIDGAVAQAEAQAAAAEATKEWYERVAAKAVCLLRVGEEPPITFTSSRTSGQTVDGSSAKGIGIAESMGYVSPERYHATEHARQRLSDECGRLATRERELLARIGEMQLEIDGLKRKARR
jgi:hypothetical protein